MQPVATFNSAGTATPGTVRNGGFEGPLVVNETGDVFLRIDVGVEIRDVTIGLDTGEPATQLHAFIFAVSDPNNVRGVIYSSSTRPDTASRSFPVLSFMPGETVYVKAVQLSGTAAEATMLAVTWRKSGGK